MKIHLIVKYWKNVLSFYGKLSSIFNPACIVMHPNFTNKGLFILKLDGISSNKNNL